MGVTRQEPDERAHLRAKVLERQSGSQGRPHCGEVGSKGVGLGVHQRTERVR
jgi:hypothetical protein